MNYLPLLTSSFAIQRRIASSILVSLVSNCTNSLYYSSKLLQFVLGIKFFLYLIFVSASPCSML